MGEPASTAFQTTSWTLIAAAAQATSESRAALAILCETYWSAVYAFIRRRGYDQDQAQDLTQGFFAVLLEKGYVGDADRQKGKFRAFLQTFVADRDGNHQREILKNDPGLHNHYQVWSKDGRWIYVVRGRPATREMDLWRIPSSGGTPEQLTHLKTDVAFPVPLDDRTLVFVAHSPQGAGPWLWVFDLKMRRAQRFSTGFEQYTAVAASADGQRLAAAVVNAQSKLWSVPIADQTVGEQAVETVQIPVARAQAPRFGGDSLFYLSSRDGADGVWRYRDRQAYEIWKGSEGAVEWPPAVSKDGDRIAFALRLDGKWRLHVMAADGTQLHRLSDDLDIRGTASWSPDGQWLVVAGNDRNGPGLFKVAASGGAPLRIATGPFLDPVWSPRGDLIVYGGTHAGLHSYAVAGHSTGRNAGENAGHRTASRRGADAVPARRFRLNLHGRKCFAWTELLAA